jgi:HEAT repeat protein
VYILWRASRSYRQALVEALRTGQPQVFFSEDRPFGGPRMDAAAVEVAVRGLSAGDAGIRRVSAEIVGHFQTPEAARALVAALADPDAPVRAAALKGLAHLQVDSALLKITAALADPEPEVRVQAVSALSQWPSPEYGVMARLEPLMADADPLVRAKAAAALLKIAELSEAKSLLHQMAADGDPQVRARALLELGDCQDDSAFELAAKALGDPQPLVRRAAAAVLADLNPSLATNLLVGQLQDEDSSVRQALAEALGRCGEPALEPLVAALADPACEAGALLALGRLPAQAMADSIRMQVKADAQAALHYHRLALGARPAGPEDEKILLLQESLRAQALNHGVNALRALSLVTARETISIALENLRSPHAAQRANALETLEAVGERETIRPLLAIWESGSASTAALPENWIADLLDDPHPWLRACAVLAASVHQDPHLKEKLNQLNCCDPDELVRSAAEHALSGDRKMETLPTLSLIERILFLRRVPLFAGLPPGDLKQVAAIASEVYLSDGQTLVQQGDAGTEMYIVVSGEVRVLVTADAHKEGREVARRQAGDYVGEMAVISQEPRMATLIAHGPVRALCLKQKHFESILRERPEISLAMLRILSQRLKEASSQAARSAGSVNSA